MWVRGCVRPLLCIVIKTEEGSTVQMELYGPSKCKKLTRPMDGGPMDRLCYVNLDHPNGQRSNGPPMLRNNLDRPKGRRSNGPPMLLQFGQSKWTTVQWTVHVTSIWTVQMDDGPMDSNLDLSKLR